MPYMRIQSARVLLLTGFVLLIVLYLGVANSPGQYQYPSEPCQPTCADLPYQTEYQASEAAHDPMTLPPYLKIHITGKNFDTLELYYPDQMYRQKLPVSFGGHTPPRLFFPTYLKPNVWVFAVKSGKEPDRFIAYCWTGLDGLKGSEECQPFPCEPISIRWVTETIARISPKCDPDRAMIIRHAQEATPAGWVQYCPDSNTWEQLGKCKTPGEKPRPRTPSNPMWQTEYRVGDSSEEDGLNDLKVFLTGLPSPRTLEMYFDTQFFRQCLPDAINLDHPPNVFPAPKEKNPDTQAVAVRFGHNSNHVIAYAWKKGEPTPVPTKHLDFSWQDKPVSVRWVTSHIAKISPCDDRERSRIIRFTDVPIWEEFSFTLTKKSFAALRAANVPEPVVIRLEGVFKEDQKDDREEFVRKIATVLDKDETERYQHLILDHAENNWKELTLQKEPIK